MWSRVPRDVTTRALLPAGRWWPDTSPGRLAVVTCGVTLPRPSHPARGKPYNLLGAACKTSEKKKSKDKTKRPPAHSQFFEAGVSANVHRCFILGMCLVNTRSQPATGLSVKSVRMYVCMCPVTSPKLRRLKAVTEIGAV